MQCLYSPISSKHLSPSSRSAAVSDASLLILPVGSVTSSFCCADAIHSYYCAPSAVLFIAHQRRREKRRQFQMVSGAFSQRGDAISPHTQPRIKVTPKQGQKTVIGARKGKGKKKVKNTEQNGKKQESRVVRKSTENVQEQTASGSTVSRKKKETASGSNSRRVGSDGVNSKSKKRKRVRSMGSGSTEEVKDREEGGGEGNEMKRRKVKEVRISDTTVAKWKPVSLATRKLLNDTMFTALGYVVATLLTLHHHNIPSHTMSYRGCLDGVKGSNKRTTEAILQQVIKRYIHITLGQHQVITCAVLLLEWKMVLQLL